MVRRGDESGAMARTRPRTLLAGTLLLAGFLLPPPATTAGPMLPKAGCSTFDGLKGNAKYQPASGATVFDNDPDVDLVGLVLRSTDTDLWAYLRVDDLVENSADGGGHRFDVRIALNNKNITLVNAVPRAPYDLVNSTEYPLVFGPDGYDDTAPVASSFDAGNNLVIFSLPLSYLASKAGLPVVRGTVLNNILARSKVLTDGNVRPSPVESSDVPMDTVQHADPAKRVWTVGDNRCFPPPPARLSGLTGLSVQYGDAAQLTARLTNETGTAGLRDKRVSFSVTGHSASVTTDANGYARVGFGHGRTAGSYLLTVAFAGDTSHGPATVTGTLVVRLETSVLSARVSKVTPGNARTVTATLTDDDRAPIAGQVVVFSVGGKSAAIRTDSRGVAVFHGAKAGQSVSVAFAGVSGKYTPARTSVRT